MGPEMGGHYGLHTYFVIGFLVFVLGFVWTHRK
jgi:hypothetical protein